MLVLLTCLTQAHNRRRDDDFQDSPNVMFFLLCCVVYFMCVFYVCICIDFCIFLYIFGFLDLVCKTSSFCATCAFLGNERQLFM